MPSNNDIEDQFFSAVKSALDASEPVAQPSEAITPPSEAAIMPAPVGRRRRRRAWGVALLCVAFAAIATVAVIAVLQVRRSSLAVLTAEPAATRPDGGADQLNATPAAFANATPGASASATALAPESTAAAESTPRASTLTIPPALPADIATPPALPPHVEVSRHTSGPAEVSKRLFTAPTRHRAKVAALASAGGPRSGLPDVRIPAAAAAAPAAPATVEGAGVPPSPTSASRSVLVSSPDHSVYWALEDSGTIFRWTDERSWQEQGSGVRSDLLAGQASSNTVCWVVGRHGTILLTTDGTRWRQIKSPTNADIIGVSAISADVADIIVADGSHLSTIDRGGYWMPTI